MYPHLNQGAPLPEPPYQGALSRQPYFGSTFLKGGQKIEMNSFFHVSSKERCINFVSNGPFVS